MGVEGVLIMGFMLNNAMKQEKDIIIDLGYANEDKTLERYKKLITFGIGVKNFQFEGFNRLLLRPPKSKIAAILKEFPIVEGGTYWQTTHRWEEA
jgi:hypothetical protein